MFQTSITQKEEVSKGGARKSVQTITFIGLPVVFIGLPGMD
jgi:hypothetical protein